MKLLFCAYDRPNYINGPNIWLQRVLPELQKKGAECRILFFPTGNISECATIQVLTQKGINCDFYTGKKYTEFRIPWILDKVNEIQPDVFIPNLCIPAYHASKWIKNSGISTVGVLHSNDPFYHAIIKEFILKEGAEHLSAVVGVSQFLEDFCKNNLSDEIIIRKIPYGVPIPEKKARYNKDTLKLLYAGRLVETQKRISDVTRAVCKMALEIPGTEATFYGSGPSESDMNRIIREHDVQDTIKLGGLVDNHRLQDKLLEGHVFVLLSDFEGLPIALMEAMACGLVPVCYNMDSGIPELVEHGKNGYLVNDRDEEFISVIKKLKADERLWEKLSGEARKKIENGYSIKISASKWYDLFELLIERAPQEKRAIEIPSEVELPERHKEIRNSEDPRWPGYSAYYGRRIMNIARRVFSK